MPHLLAILILLVSLVASAGYGWLWLRLLDRAGRADPLYPVHALALGLGTLAYLVLGLGLLGFLTPAGLGALLAAGWVPGVFFLREQRKGWAGGRPAAPGATPRERRLTAGLGAYLGLLGLATLASALRPVDGLDWDSLSYHLAAPKIYLREGRIPFIAYDSHTHFPFTLEMLYTLGLQFGGSSGAKLFHWASGWLTALALGLWTSRLEVAGRRAPAWSGPLAAAVFASMPVVLWEMGTAYVDLGTALFQFLALAALVDAVSMREGRPEVRLAGAALAGMHSGFALGTKYTALLQFGLLGLGLLWVLLRSGPGWRAALAATGLFGVLGLAVASPWYLKNWLWVHNPVYPFFYTFFPASFSWTREAEIAYATEQRSFGLGRGPAEAVRAFWDLGMHGRAFYINQRTLMGDRLGSLGPIWAGLFPLLLWTRGLGWRAGALLAYSLASVALWFVLSQQVRYLVPVFAPLAVVMAVTPAALPSRLLRGAAGVFLALALLLNFQMHAPLARVSLQVLTGEIGAEEYLDMSLPGLYESAGFVNGLPEGSRVALYQETRGYYFDRPYFWANPLQHNLIPYARLRDGGELTGELRRFGITHVLINYDFCRGVERADWYRLLMAAIQEGRLREVFRSRGGEFTRRGVFVYTLEAAG